MREKHKPMLAGGFLIAIMVLSTLGYVIGGSGDTIPPVRYNDFTFKNEKNLWTTTINDQKKYFFYIPQDLEIENSTLLQAIKDSLVIAITYDANSTFVETLAEAQYRLEQELSYSRVSVVRGLTTAISSVPKITCANATVTMPVILLQEGNQTRFTQEPDCIIAEGFSQEDIIRITDRILYFFLGVMP